MTAGNAPGLMVLASTAEGRETEALLRLTSRANDALTVEEIFEPALDAVLELLQVQRAAILLFDEHGVVRFRAWRGLSDEYRRTVEGHSPWARSAKDALAFCTPDVAQDAALAPYLELFREERVRSLAFIPLVCRGELLGKFMAYSESPRTFTARELALGQAVAAQVAQACARVQLIEAERTAREVAERSADRLRRLLRVTSGLSNALFAEEIAAAIIDEGTLALDARSGGIWLLRGEQLTLLRQRGYSEATVARVGTMAITEHVPVARTAQLGRAIWLESHADYQREFPSFARWTAMASPARDAELAVAALPLVIQGRVIGALGIAFQGQRKFDEQERAFLTLLAQHCAHGLERARLYEEARAAEGRSRFLAQVSGLLASSLDYETTLRHLAALVVPEMADWCTVDLVDDHGKVAHAAIKHVDASKVELARIIREKYPPDPEGEAGIYNVIRTGKPELYEEISDDVLVALTVDDEHLRTARTLGLKSAMIVPMRAHGHSFGTITFVSAESGRRYNEADLAIALQVAERAGVAVHNAGLYQRAIAAIQLRDEFLSVAGHELRTPLTALLLQAQSLARSSQEPSQGERAKQRAERLTRSAARLSKLVDELLDVTRITSGRLQLSPESLDLGELVSEVLQGASEQIERSRSPVRCSGGEGLRGAWDRHRLEQVVMNLLSNALKYGNEQPITITLTREDEQAVLRIRDHGIGISVEDQARIFGRFERAVSPRNFGGLGLGLWIARQIVEAHGGTIEVWSVQGQGSEFTVRLPLVTGRPEA